MYSLSAEQTSTVSEFQADGAQIEKGTEVKLFVTVDGLPEDQRRDHATQCRDHATQVNQSTEVRICIVRSVFQLS